MTEDDDNLDYTAWEAPSPPPGIADAVVAKLRRPIGAPDVEPSSPRRLRWIATGGIAAAAAAGITILAWPGSSTTTTPSTSGNVVAAKPSHVELGASTVALDANAEIKWSRDGARVAVAQPRGSAMWRVAPEDTLVIDAGATVASVEASGASLRVEVQMNLADKRLIGTSAVTAAAVALVTVVVYEGHVKVTSSGQTLQLAAGGTAEVRPGEPPREPPVIAVGPRTVAPPAPAEFGAVEFEQLLDHHAADLLACGRGFGGKLMLEIAIDSARNAVVSTSPKVAFTDCLQRTVDKFELPPAAAGMSLRSSLLFEPDSSCKWGEALALGDASAISGDHDVALRHYEASLACKHQDSVVNKAFLAACKSKHEAKAKALYPKLRNRGLVQVCLREGIDPREANHVIDIDAYDNDDCDEKKKLADLRQMNGDHAGALLGYEAVMRCDPRDANIAAKAFLAACNSKNEAKAKALFPKLSASHRMLQQRCIAHGMDPDWFPGSPAPVDDTSSVDRAKTGVLRVNSEPWARVTIDGDASTTTDTPAKFELKPGKHKVMFQVGNDKYTFSVTIKAGQVTTMTKDLQ